MPLRVCDAGGRINPVDRVCGSRMICARHYCVEHMKKNYHKCPPEDEDSESYWRAYDAARTSHLAALLDKVNVNAMEDLLTQIRGVRCSIPALAAQLDQAAKIELVSSQMGGENCHVDAEFEDGVTWIVRIRLTDPTLPPREVQDYILQSEVATLKFLAHTSVPVPKVYHHQLESQDDSSALLSS